MNRRKEIESQDKIITKILLKLFKIGLALVKALSGGKKILLKLNKSSARPNLLDVSVLTHWNCPEW